MQKLFPRTIIKKFITLLKLHLTAFYQCDISVIAMNDCVKRLWQNNLYLSFISIIDSLKAYKITLSFSSCSYNSYTLYWYLQYR